MSSTEALKRSDIQAALLLTTLKQLVEQHLRAWPRLRLCDFGQLLDYTRTCVQGIKGPGKKQCASRKLVRARMVVVVGAVMMEIDKEEARVKDEDEEKLMSLIEEMRLTGIQGFVAIRYAVLNIVR
ncbi:hypothetical protein RUND412_007689 [Rhizina undulata]